MKFKSLTLLIPVLTLSLPLIASAHEIATYQIGSANYQFVVGSLNEPVVVDDKTGVDLTVNKCSSAACTSVNGAVGAPVLGLDQTLKATLIAGAKKKEVSLSAQYGKPGAYTSPFYLTVATTFSYEFTGTINGVPVDLTFTCLPDGTPKAPLDTTRKTISDQVTQTSLSGGFGCPLEKAALGFPESSSALQSVAGLATTARSFALVALALAALALALVFARRR